MTEKPVAVTIEDINNLCVEIKGYREQARLTLEHNRADEDDLGVHAFEVSLLNCFGLDILYMVMTLPFISKLTKYCCNASTWNCPSCD